MIVVVDALLSPESASAVADAIPLEEREKRERKETVVDCWFDWCDFVVVLVVPWMNWISID